MVRSRILPAAMAAVIALAGTAGIASAADNKRGGEAEDGREIAALLNAKTSLTQAIAAAEQQTGGKAIEAELEDEDGALSFEVKVAKDKTVQYVHVDPQSGKVMKVTAADSDESGEFDED